MKHAAVDDRPPAQLLRFAAAFLVGGIVGAVILVFIYLLMGKAFGGDDVAHSLGGGIGCLVTGTILLLAFRPAGAIARFTPVLVALLLGTGVALSTVGVFWYFQWDVYGYERHEDLHYLLGEVGGYSGPGLGLLTCGLVLLWSYLIRPENGYPSRDLRTALPAPSRPHSAILHFLSLLALAAILGTGAGMLDGAMTYVLKGKGGSTSELAGFLASGFSFLTTGIIFFVLCAVTRRVTWLSHVVLVLFLLTGLILCGIGISDWLAYSRTNRYGGVREMLGLISTTAVTRPKDRMWHCGS